MLNSLNDKLHNENVQKIYVQITYSPHFITTLTTDNTDIRGIQLNSRVQIKRVQIR